MKKNLRDLSCSECGEPVENLPTTAEFDGQEIFLFDPVVCPKCLLDLCKKYSAVCANCGKSIPPYSQVGVLKGDGGSRQYVHMTTACSTAGSAFHGYWGRGQLHNFIEIEAC